MRDVVFVIDTHKYLLLYLRNYVVIPNDKRLVNS